MTRMKTLFGVMVLLAAFSGLAEAATYYSQGSLDVTSLSSWNSARDGSGSAPANFTSGDAFTVQNGNLMTAGALWTVSGAGSNVLIETGGQITSGLFNHALTLNMNAGGTWVNSNTTYSALTFGTFNSASLFRLDNQSSPRTSGLTYGNLTFNGTSNVSLTANLNVTGNLRTANTGQLRLTNSSNLSHSITADVVVDSTRTMVLTQGTGNVILNLSGTLTNSGNITKPGSGTATINFIGSNTSTVTWGTHSNPIVVTIGSSRNLTFADNLNVGSGNLTVNGVLNVGNNSISGTGGSFTLASGATFITDNAIGLNGSVTVTGTRQFSSGANYEFRGAGMGNSMPGTVNNLTINRSSGNVTLDGSVGTQTVNGLLNVYSGKLVNGSNRNTLDLYSTAANVITLRNAELAVGAGIGQVNLWGASGGGITFDPVDNGTGIISGTLNINPNTGTSLTRIVMVGDGSAAVDMRISGNIIQNLSGANGIQKEGLGTLELSGNNVFTGLFAVNAGKALINNTLGTGTGTGNVTVASGATLGGSGLIDPADGNTVAINGYLAPGNSIGTLTVGSLGSTNEATLNGTFLAEVDTSGLADLLTVQGNLILNGSTSVLSIVDTGQLNTSQTYTIANYSGTLTGTFSSNNLPPTWSVNYGTGTNSTITLVAVPEPGTLALLAFGSMAVMKFRRKKNP